MLGQERFLRTSDGRGCRPAHESHEGERQGNRVLSAEADDLGPAGCVPCQVPHYPLPPVLLARHRPYGRNARAARRPNVACSNHSVRRTRDPATPGTGLVYGPGMVSFHRRPATSADAWRFGEFTVPDPATLRIGPPSATQLQRIGTALRRLGVGTDDLYRLASTYDATYQAWSVRPVVAREDERPLVERLSAGLGQYLVDEAAMAWQCGTDTGGTEYDLVAGHGDQVLYPAGLVAAYWSRGRVGWVVDVIGAIRRSATGLA